MTTIDRIDDQRMMEHPERWPRWPVLPIKRRMDHGLPDYAVMLAIEHHGTTVVHINLSYISNGKTLNQIVEDSATTVYPDIDSLLDDGWIVD